MTGEPAGAVPAVTKPENCVMLVGIPTTERAFSESIWQDANRFAGRFWSFRHYETDFLRPFTRFAFRARRLGLRIETAATRSTIRWCTSLPNVHGCVVFSHWDDDAGVVELADGFASVGAVVAEFPTDYEGFVDLSTYTSHRLAAELRVSRRRVSSIVYRSSETTPRVWLGFYDLVFRLLHRRDLDYVSATDQIAREWIDAAEELHRRDPTPCESGGEVRS